MQVKYNSGSLEVVVEADTQQELFEELAAFQEVFNLNHTIKGKVVDPNDLRFQVRTDKEENKYYELAYRGQDRELWGYRLPFGCNKKGGGLFPKWSISDEDKDKYEDGGNGWRKFKSGNSNSTRSEDKTQKAPF